MTPERLDHLAACAARDIARSEEDAKSTNAEIRNASVYFLRNSKERAELARLAKLGLGLEKHEKEISDALDKAMAEYIEVTQMLTETKKPEPGSLWQTKIFKRRVRLLFMINETRKCAEYPTMVVYECAENYPAGKWTINPDIWHERFEEIK